MDDVYLAWLHVWELMRTYPFMHCAKNLSNLNSCCGVLYCLTTCMTLVCIQYLRYFFFSAQFCELKTPQPWPLYKKIPLLSCQFFAAEKSVIQITNNKWPSYTLCFLRVSFTHLVHLIILDKEPSLFPWIFWPKGWECFPLKYRNCMQAIVGM